MFLNPGSVLDDMMHNVERIFQWDVVSFFVGVLVTFAFGFVQFKEYTPAKVCFALSVLFLAGKVMMWDRLLNLPLAWRFAACCLVFGILGFLFVESIRWVDKKKPDLGGSKENQPHENHDIATSLASDKRLRILVCTFDGPDPSVYRVTDLIIEGLNKIASENEEVDVILEKSVSAAEGSKKARRIGKEVNAAIVLWGWYTKTKETALVTAHFEVPESISEMPTHQGSEVLTMTVGNLETFEMQLFLSQDLRYLASVALGLVYYGEKNYDTALKLLTDAINISRSSSSDQFLNPAVTYYYRGNVYNFQGEYERAVRDFTTSINISPNQGTYLNRSNSHFSLGNFDDARADLRKAIDIDAQYKEAYVNLGIVEFVDGNPDKAIELYNRSLALDPNQPKAYFNRSVVNLLTGKVEIAINDLNAAIKLDPEYSNAFQNRGAIFFNQGRFEEAMPDLNRAIELEPENATYYFNRAAAYIKQHRDDLARDDLTKGLKLDPTNAEAYFNRAITYDDSDRELEIADLSEAIRLDPNYVKAYMNRAATYAVLKEKDRALADFNKCIEIDPRIIAARQARVVIFIEKKRFADAIPDLEFIIKTTDDKAFQEQTKQLLKEVKEELDKLRHQKKSGSSKKRE